MNQGAVGVPQKLQSLLVNRNCDSRDLEWKKRACVCVRVLLYMCMCVHTYVLCLCAYVSACVNARMCVCTCVSARVPEHVSACKCMCVSL